MSDPNGWQPIETAPLDGTPILGWWDNVGCDWPPEPDTLAQMGVVHFEGGCWFEAGDDVIPPKYWHPLPPPPATPDEDDGA